jgi:ATP-dependent DNA helicase DinG
LNETLYSKTYSVVFTSATLSIDGSFDSFTKALGLGENGEKATDFLQLDSSYDFDENMTIFVPTDMPDPTQPSYLSKLQKLLVEVHRAQGGSTLTLFTNRREMDSCFKVVQPAIAADKLRLVCQRKGGSVKNLRDEFVKDEHLSMMALKSFWEGFDAPGATLKTVVIPKLPFKKPSDPLSCEREENDPRAWAHYVLPAAIIETKQAAGRLIRSSTDKGNLILADHRLVTKNYGKKFLNSMPSKNIKFLTIAQIVRELEMQ